VLIIPVAHTPTLSSIEDPTARAAVLAEMQKYRAALHAMLSSLSKDPSTGDATLGAITWEISRSSGVHTHWQFLPIPSSLITSEQNQNLVAAAFIVEAENSSYPHKFATSPEDIASAEQGDYFKVMIWCEDETKTMEMVLPLDETFRFDLQFGRRVAGKLLGLQERTHWKDCGQSKAEEEKECEGLKQVFAPFDFTAASE
jgi:hypothetical protein